MNANNSITILTGKDILKEFDIIQKISDVINDSEKVSKEKYEAKLKLIKSATDISTQEKLDAMDKNYNCWNQEHWQNRLLTFAIVSIVSFSVLRFAVGNPTDIKQCTN